MPGGVAPASSLGCPVPAPATVPVVEVSLRECGRGVSGVVIGRPVNSRSGDEERIGNDPRGFEPAPLVFIRDGGFECCASRSVEPGASAVGIW